MDDREKQILTLLCKHGSLSIDELARLLSLSPSSVRRILGELGSHRYVRRTHGGVSLTGVIRYTPLPIYKHAVDPKEARAISGCAVQEIERGDVIGLSGGRICTELALHMRMLEGIAVVTNAVNIAAELAALPGIQIVQTGGQLDPESFELVGEIARASLEGIRIHKFFVGTDGITPDYGLTNRNEAEGLIAREFMRHSDQVILLADSTKFKRSNLALVAPISQIHEIITTDRTPQTVLSQFESAGIKCIVAPLEE